MEQAVVDKLVHDANDARTKCRTKEFYLSPTRNPFPARDLGTGQVETIGARRVPQVETLTSLTMAIICPEIPRKKIDLTLSLLRLGVPQQGSSPSQPSYSLSSSESSVVSPTSGQSPRSGEQRSEKTDLDTQLPSTEAGICSQYRGPNLGTLPPRYAFAFGTHLILLFRGRPPISRYLSSGVAGFKSVT
ncbi:hypothetical protein ACLB2K_060107 [Fragaria x ananassa]